MRPNSEKPSHEGLIRIQNEISEVEKREIELKKEHETVRVTSDNGHVDHNSSGSSSTSSDREQSPEPVVIKFSTKDEFKKNKTVQPTAKPNFIQLPVPGLTRALSTPQLFQVSPMKRFNAGNQPQRGIMERFIASRGKIIGNQQRSPIHHPQHQQNFKNNLMMSPIEFKSGNGVKPTFNDIVIEKPTIERDNKGRPIRRGYIPVEEKIQTELRDLRSREFELKRLNKLKIRDSDEDDDISSIDTDTSSDWNPISGKLSKSIDALNSSSSLSPSPETKLRPIPQPRGGGVLRPAVSLAQLCDLDESEETPSSHKLIERWESIIQENQQRERSYNIN